MTAYILMVRFLRFVLRVFFRQIEVVGLENVPEHGAVIFAGNHPNSLIDPTLIITTCDRRLTFAANELLFESRVLRIFLDVMGCVPIRRRMDHGGNKVDNADAFQALHNVLAEEGAIGIFPEGISHSKSQLAQFKTGTARIAINARRLSPETPVYIVPCGLNYIRPKRFRSRVLIQYGPAIEVTPEDLELAEQDERATVHRLTDDIEAGLREQTINTPDWDQLRLLDAARRLYQPPRISLNDRIELSRRFATVYASVQHQPDVIALTQRVQNYLDTLTVVGLNQYDLLRPLTGEKVLMRTLGNLLLLLVWLPLSIPGLVLHMPLAFLCSLSAAHLSPRKDVIATSKVLAGVIAYLIAYGGILYVFWHMYGWMIGLTVTLLVPLSGYAALRVMERWGALNRIWRRTWRILALRPSFEHLRNERKALQSAIMDAVDRHLPDGMAPLFPRDQSRRGDVA